MKLNCDMGESYGSWVMGNDEAVMPWVDMANIACGFHASDPQTMFRTIQLAVKNHVTIGAHPGYDDKQGFGRRSIPHTPTAITSLVAYQTGALDAICQFHDTNVSYVKPHGALYHDMMAIPEVYEAILQAVAGLDRNPSLVILARLDNREYIDLAREYGVSLIFEAFADRAYSDDGSLVDRSEPGAVFHDEIRILQQVQGLANGEVITREGNTLELEANTVCVHGDNPESVALIQRIYQELNR
ncbi:5-oxoprolinase subunit PxpA [Endozoicomonadaceae bacterium StTr2]